MKLTKENKALRQAIEKAKREQTTLHSTVYEHHEEGTELERTFDTWWNRLCPDLPKPCKWKFLEGRNYEVDRGFPGLKIAVELEGLDHRRNDRYACDILKYNLLAREGILLFRVTTLLMRDDPEGFILMVAGTVRQAIRLQEENQ